MSMHYGATSIRIASRLPHYGVISRRSEKWRGWRWGEQAKTRIGRINVSLGCTIASLGCGISIVDRQVAGSSRVIRALLASAWSRVAAFFPDDARCEATAALCLARRPAGTPAVPGGGPGSRLFPLPAGYCRISGTEQTAYGPPRSLPSGGLRRL